MDTENLNAALKAVEEAAMNAKECQLHYNNILCLNRKHRVGGGKRALQAALERKEEAHKAERDARQYLAQLETQLGLHAEIMDVGRKRALANTAGHRAPKRVRAESPSPDAGTDTEKDGPKDVPGTPGGMPPSQEDPQRIGRALITADNVCERDVNNHQDAYDSPLTDLDAEMVIVDKELGNIPAVETQDLPELISMTDGLEGADDIVVDKKAGTLGESRGSVTRMDNATTSGSMDGGVSPSVTTVTSNISTGGVEHRTDEHKETVSGRRGQAGGRKERPALERFKKKLALLNARDKSKKEKEEENQKEEYEVLQTWIKKKKEKKRAQEQAKRRKELEAERRRRNHDMQREQGMGGRTEIPSDRDDEEDDDEGESEIDIKEESGGRNRYITLSPEKQRKLRIKARQQIYEFLEDPVKGKVNFGIRRAIRLNSELLPQAATSSRQLAIHILTSRNGHLLCIHHSLENQTREKDGYKTSRRFRISGVPGQRVMYGQPSNADYMHCGCLIDTALLDFYLYKTWFVTSQDGGLVESMLDTHFSPRIREFVVQNFRRITGLTVDDLYTASDMTWTGLSDDEALTTARQKVLRSQINKLALELRQLTISLGESPEEEMAAIFMKLKEGTTVGMPVGDVLQGLITMPEISQQDEDEKGHVESSD